MQNSPINQNMLNMLRLFSNAKNPMQFLTQQFGNNPRFQTLVKLLDGKSPEQKEQVMRNYLQEQGINPDGVIQTVQQLGFMK